MNVWQTRSILMPVLLGTLLLAIGCSSIPTCPEKPTTIALPPAREGMLQRTRALIAADTEPGQSSFLLLHSNADALNWRLALIDEATTSIDLKVSLWQNDETGRLLYNRLVGASRRGVRIRLLVNDLALSTSDSSAAAIAAMENIDLRRVNAKAGRPGVQNKLMVVDGHWGMVGGRNIGNSYFGSGSHYNIRELDTLVTGPICRDLNEAFDSYWNSDAAYPASAMGSLTPKKRDKHMRQVEQAIARDQTFLKATPHAYEPRNWSILFSGLPAQMTAGTARYLYGPPSMERNVEHPPLSGLVSMLRNAETCITLVTPNIVAPPHLIEALQAAHNKGTEVQLLTASMGASSDTTAHSDYKRYRKKLLKAGVQLCEYRHHPSPDERALCDAPPCSASFVALHLNAAAIDHRYLVVGSVNLDPKALNTQTDHAMVIDSPPLAEAFEQSVAIMRDDANGWELYRNQHGFLRWRAGDQHRRTQPARSLPQRMANILIRLFPLKQL